MKFKNYILLLLMILPLLSAQSDLAVVRVDNGDNELLPLPQDIDLSALEAIFDPQVDTLLFLHGFMNTVDSATATYTMTHGLIRPFLGHMNYVGVCWPADYVVLFGQAIENADDTGPYIAYILETITSWYGNNGGCIHLLSHSLGGRVLLSTLQSGNSHNISWGICSLFGPAVHDDSFINEFPGAEQVAAYNWVYYSVDDPVLKYLYALWYGLFGIQGWQEMPGALDFASLSPDNQFAYMRNIEAKVRRGETLSTQFDYILYQQIQTAEVEAMGLVGAQLGGYVGDCVSNIDVTGLVNGHSYWDNVTALEMVADKIIEFWE